MTSVSRSLESGRRLRLTLECAALFVGLPVVMAVAVSPYRMRDVFIGATVVALVLLIFTPGFRWRSLVEGPILREWRAILLFTLVTMGISAALVLWLSPERFLAMPRHMTELWLRIMIWYPFLSALPQEIIYRVLFFERYGPLFPGRRWAIAANAACFGLAHLFYLNWPAVLLTTLGGVVFAWAYAGRRSFGLAFLLHMLGGQIIFTFGLGIYFYHGAIGAV